MTDDLLADRADRDTHEMVIAPPVGMMDVPIQASRPISLRQGAPLSANVCSTPRKGDFLECEIAPDDRHIVGARAFPANSRLPRTGGLEWQDSARGKAWRDSGDFFHRMR